MKRISISTVSREQIFLPAENLTVSWNSILNKGFLLLNGKEYELTDEAFEDAMDYIKELEEED